MCRCGPISCYQLQPGPEVLHRDSRRQNIQRSGSRVHRHRAPQGRARTFHPASELARRPL